MIESIPTSDRFPGINPVSPILRGMWVFLAGSGIAGFLMAQEDEGPESAPARLAVLLDTSAEMGFIVPQVRKEVRHLNAELKLVGRPAVGLREIEGARLDREGSLAVPARRNNVYALKALYGESGFDTVYWITALSALVDGRGFFAVEQLLQDRKEGRPPRRLIIRNIWQDQVQAGDAWVRHSGESNTDPLDPGEFPDDWYHLVEKGRGFILRSWQRPPEEFRDRFAFPYRIANSAFLRKLGHTSREATFDMAWARELSRSHRLEFIGRKEEWPSRITGRRWVFESSLVPFISEETRGKRSEAVFEEMCVRETIEEDLVRIGAKKIGVLFGFGYLEGDLSRFRAMEERPTTNWRINGSADLARIVAETREHRAKYEKSKGEATLHERVYLTEMIELQNWRERDEGPDPFAAAMAKLIREAGVDAIYFFTNGYVGGGDVGTWGIDENLVALAIREAGVPLYLRVPFEFGPIPISLQRLVLASGGGVFLGSADDEDWDIRIPSSSWPPVGAGNEAKR